ncbi:protein TIFY 10b-like [Phalaenopsis equestris]|uniref:protein TIFY 10b-like n=1 Tax=Phalaenopsis equestris TaxID=78828 RepID=UPI0009E4617B|nr:protein TIFY 10b-like [Phalaenopsis equestris]
MTNRPEKSGFSLTCSLLSHYIKEKGCFADLGIGMPSRALDSSNLGKSETYHSPTTMNLLPGVDGSGNDCEGTKKDSLSFNAERSMEVFPQQVGVSLNLPPAEAKESEKAQLTIFYGGKVRVFDNFPAEKAKDLIQIASKGENFTSGSANAMAPSTPATGLPSLSAPANFPARAQPNFSDLPIARKASLHRFLQKRKERISALSPYQLSGRTDSKDVATKEEMSQKLTLLAL